MLKWHLISSDGQILRTCAAESKRDAQAMLGPGYVVSDISWKMDVHKFEPVRTVVTDITQDQDRKAVIYFYKKGFRTAVEIAKDFNARENQVRHIIDKHRIGSVSKVFGGRKVRFFSPASCRRIKSILDKTDPERVMRNAVARSYALWQSSQEEL